MSYMHQIFPYGNYKYFYPGRTEINFWKCDRMLRKLLPECHTVMLSVCLLFLWPNKLWWEMERISFAEKNATDTMLPPENRYYVTAWKCLDHNRKPTFPLCKDTNNLFVSEQNTLLATWLLCLTSHLIVMNI